MGVVVAVGLYFVLDVAALHYVESQGAAELAQTLTAEDATVDLGSVPFVLSFITGRLSHAEVDVRGASGPGGLRVQSLQARMSEVRFSWRRILALTRSSFAPRTEVKASDPLGIVELGQNDLEDFIRRHLPAVGDFKILASGVEVRFVKNLAALKPGAEPSESELTEPARYLPRVFERRIVLSLVGLSAVPKQYRTEAGRLERIIDLPKIPEGLRTDVRLGDGVITIEASGPEVSLEIGEGQP